jgi:DNA-binding NarL/FixJ family response regulator
MRGELRGIDGVDDLRESVGLLHKEPVLLERARAHLALAQALLSGPEELPAELEEAMAALFTALDLAETCAAEGVRRTVAGILAEHGILIPESVRQVVCLTTTERRIATLAVDGVSDREVAEAFFLTPRTIQATLASVKERLGVATLDELRAALADL